VLGGLFLSELINVAPLVNVSDSVSQVGTGAILLVALLASKVRLPGTLRPRAKAV